MAVHLGGGPSGTCTPSPLSTACAVPSGTAGKKERPEGGHFGFGSGRAGRGGGRSVRDGVDPQADPPRTLVPVRHGQLLLMPAEWGRYTGVKLATVAPANPARRRPRIQGDYLLLDAETLSPLAVLDGVALTTIRTAAVSAVAADRLAVPNATRLLVFGSGPQAGNHIARCARYGRSARSSWSAGIPTGPPRWSRTA
jgi:Ornithine cyclodeaminase/mu-crystallin family